MKVLSAVLVVKGISISWPPVQSNRHGKSSFSMLLSQAKPSSDRMSSVCGLTR